MHLESLEKESFILKPWVGWVERKIRWCWRPESPCTAAPLVRQHQHIPKPIPLVHSCRVVRACDAPHPSSFSNKGLTDLHEYFNCTTLSDVPLDPGILLGTPRRNCLDSSNLSRVWLGALSFPASDLLSSSITTFAGAREGTVIQARNKGISPWYE